MILLTVEQFRNAEPARASLASAFKVNDEILRSAVTTLRHHAMIYTDPPTKPGIHPDAVAAHEYYRRQGWNQALIALEQLCEPMPSASDREKAAARDPWSDYAAADSDFMKGAPPKPEEIFNKPIP